MRTENEEVTRVRTPRENEILGIVEDMLGGGRFRVNCTDKRTRICRVSGKFKRRQWIRPGDVVLVKPWEVQGDERGDVVWKYRRAQIDWLKKKGYLE
ncbi:MAG: translation initiation factor eIF-1A [Candidatus Aenigmarchaeota archaeon]|nr:translation initiation factor eIF-1A [Candidatus Aenigmarchaeota archaeon]NIP40757.1 translation initiation factor eIF-1A [Candidatus Aenigmarchaeota archaeon]NIQ18563.1 translation initiation factor eIF-1A [Candidatus Aenigmarchaeota archaeon]NIS73462.1 translation initiation factor eIF-1A [Candidatus Aenigmarchaeota archaeon]